MQSDKIGMTKNIKTKGQNLFWHANCKPGMPNLLQSSNYYYRSWFYNFWTFGKSVLEEQKSSRTYPKTLVKIAISIWFEIIVLSHLELQKVQEGFYKKKLQFFCNLLIFLPTAMKVSLSAIIVCGENLKMRYYRLSLHFINHNRISDIIY